MLPEQHPPAPPGAAAAAEVISAEMVRIHTESYGSGAKVVETYVHEDLVLSILDVELLPAEVAVIAQGRSDLVLELRSSFQLELETSFTAAVERATGRKVIAFLSNTHLDPPFVTELFRLAPADGVEIAEPEARAEVDGASTELRGLYESNVDAPKAARLALAVFAERLARNELDVLHLLVGELVTNAVVHGGGDADGSLELDVTLADGELTGEVRDGGPGFEYVRRTPGAEGGWGLFLVELLATRWGVDRNPKRVWFAIAGAPA